MIIQILIFLQHLLAYSGSEEHRPPGAKGLPAAGLLTIEQEAWIRGFHQRTISFLSSRDPGGILGNIATTIFYLERNWMAWKSNSCPPFDLASCALSCSNETKVKKAFYDMRKFNDPNYLASPELSRLWAKASGGMENLQDRRLKPTLHEYLEPLAEQLDPEAGIEEQYTLSKEELYRWKLMRLFLFDQEQPSLFAKCGDASEVEAVCQSLFDIVERPSSPFIDLRESAELMDIVDSPVADSDMPSDAG